VLADHLLTVAAPSSRANAEVEARARAADEAVVARGIEAHDLHRVSCGVVGDKEVEGSRLAKQAGAMGGCRGALGYKATRAYEKMRRGKRRDGVTVKSDSEGIRQHGGPLGASISHALGCVSRVEPKGYERRGALEG
jgi:hypothetical protein